MPTKNPFNKIDETIKHLIETCYPKLAKETVQIEQIRPGNGRDFPVRGDRVTVHYTGIFEDGKIFDTSLKKSRPFTFRLGMGHVIKGWDFAVPKMSIGEISKLVVQPEFGYGKKGHPPKIPGNAVLIFEIELLSIG